MTRKPPLAPADLERLRHTLEQKRDSLIESSRSTREEARAGLDEAIESGDVAEQMIEQESALRTNAADTALLAEVEGALRRLEAGTYGVSEESGEPIELERLDAIPWARRTAAEEQRR